MRRHLAPAVFAAALCGVAHPAVAQVAPTDRDALVRDAQQAAVNAAKAAEAARVAADRAAKAAAALSEESPGGVAETTATATARAPAAPVRPRAPISTDATLVRRKIAASVANGPNDRSLKSSVAPDFQLIASDKEKVASLAWTVDVSGRSRSGFLSADQLTVTASSKLNGKGEARFLGLNGFTGGTEVGLSYIHYGSRIALSGIEKTQEAVARDNCLAEPPSDPPESCEPTEYPTGVSEFVVKYNPQGFGALIDEVLPGPVWFYGTKFAGSQTTFTYLDRAAFAMKDTKRFGYSGSVFGGLIFGHGATAIEAGFAWRRTDDEQDPVEICQPLAGTIQTQCQTGPDGAPVRSSRAIASVSLRHAFPVNPGDNWSLAVGPEFSADVKNNAWSIDVPVYFAPNESGKLRGGVRAIYQNQRKAGGGREDGVTLALFVGVPFSLFHR